MPDLRYAGPSAEIDMNLANVETTNIGGYSVTINPADADYDLVLIPSNCSEILVKVGTEERPASKEDVEHVQWALDDTMEDLGPRFHHVITYVAPARSTLMLLGGHELSGMWVSRTELPHLILAHDGPRVVRCGSDDYPASESTLSRMMGFIDGSIPDHGPVIVCHHAWAIYWV